MLAIISQAIKRKKWSIFIYSLAGVLFMWMFVAMYPSIANEAEVFQEAFSNYPKEFFQIFNIETLNFDSLEKFLAIENFSIMWPLLVLFMGIALAGTNIAGEIEKGTMSLILARPISRATIFVAKYLAGMLSIFIFIVLSIFFIIPLATLHNVSYILESYITIAVLGFFFSLAIYSLSMLFSSIFSEKSKVYMVMGGIIFPMYLFNVVANLRNSWEDLRYFSFFHYFDYNKALFDYAIGWESLFVFGATIIITFTCGILIFKHRDVAI